MYYSWLSFEEFDLWHNTVCESLGIPHPNYNAATGDIDIDAQWTTDYTAVIEVYEDDWRAFVEDDVANSHPNGLGIFSEPPATLDRYYGNILEQEDIISSEDSNGS